MMPSVRDSATVVLDSEEIPNFAASRRREPRSPRPVTTRQVRAWEAALRLAEGDARRLVLNSDDSVTVHNQPR